MATVTLTKANFEQVLSENPIVFLDFWAAWCGPCKAFGPVFEAASRLHPDVVFGKIDTEKEPELASMFGIRSIPTVMAFREDIGVFSQPGALPPQALEQIIAKVKALNMDEVRKSIADQEAKRA